MRVKMKWIEREAVKEKISREPSERVRSTGNVRKARVRSRE